jgi:hypothetical protein
MSRSLSRVNQFGLIFRLHSEAGNFSVHCFSDGVEFACFKRDMVSAHDYSDLENIVPHSLIPVDENAIWPIALESLQGSRPNGESDDLFG